MVRTAVIGNHVFYRPPLGPRERQQLTQVRAIAQPETGTAAAKSRDA
jgi:hypothetical protein